MDEEVVTWSVCQEHGEDPSKELAPPQSRLGPAQAPPHPLCRPHYHELRLGNPSTLGLLRGAIKKGALGR